MIEPENIEDCMKFAIGLIPTPIPPRFKNKPISLANYDVSFVNNVVRSINSGDGLSDKQRDLSVKLVTKYVRQFKKLGIDVTVCIDNPKFSSPLRQVDRTKTIEIDTDRIYVKFPYNKEMITSFKALLNKSLHSTTSGWSKEERRYEVDYNEYNLLQIDSWTKKYRFKYSTEVISLVSKFKSMISNRSKYAIQLIVNENDCELVNAPDSLSDWWKDNVQDKPIIDQVVKAADQNIDVVNRSNTFKLNYIANKILTGRGSEFRFDDCTINELVQGAQELGFKRIAYIVDGRTIQSKQVSQFTEVIEELGYADTVCLVKHLNVTINANRRFTSDTKFAILDSIQRFSHNKSQTDWKPDFVIHTNGITKLRSSDYIETKAPWLCLYSNSVGN